MGEQISENLCSDDEQEQNDNLWQLEKLKKEYLETADAYLDLCDEYNKVTSSVSYKMSRPFCCTGEYIRKKISDNNCGRLLYKMLDSLHQGGIGYTWKLIINKIHILLHGELQIVAGCSENHLSDKPELEELFGNIGVHVHLYYTDLLEEFCGYLDNIPYPFDLFVSVREGEDLSFIQKRLQQIRNVKEVTAAYSINRGRDLAPLYVQFGDKIKDYRYFLHIHTKKSLFTGSEQSDWRHYCLDSVLGSEQLIKRIFYQMENEKVGLFFSDVFGLMDVYVNTWMDNTVFPTETSQKLGIPCEEDFFNYPVGSFFWAKTDALLPIFNMQLSYHSFPEENGQIDGTLAHTLERIIGPLARSRGYHLGIYDCFTDELCYDQSLRIYQQYFSEGSSQVYSKLCGKETVSFSLFDTLITRKVLYPEDIFPLMEAKISKEYGFSGTFAELRKKAQIIAEHKNGVFCTLKNIYEELRNLGELSSDVMYDLMNIESELELQLCIPRVEMLNIYRDLQAQGKKIVILCDTYLPEKLISMMLARCGYSEWNELWISNERGVCKEDKTIWTPLLGKYGRQLLHCGNDPRKDAVYVDERDISKAFIMTPRMELKLAPFYEKLRPFLHTTPENAVLLGLLINGYLFNSPYAQDCEGKPKLKTKNIYNRFETEQLDKSEKILVILQDCNALFESCGLHISEKSVLKEIIYTIL